MASNLSEQALLEENQRLRQELAESREALRKYKECLDFSLVIGEQVWWEWDIQRKTITVYSAARCILGYTEEACQMESPESLWWDRTHPEDLAQVKQSLEAHFRGETHEWRCEHRYRDADGEYRWILNYGKVIERDAEAKPLRLLGIVKLIHDQKIMQEALAVQERSLLNFRRALFEHNDISITDEKGVITYVSQTFTKLSGYTSEEVIGKTHQVLNSGYHPPEFFRELWNTLKRGEVWHGEIRNRRKEGTFYWVHATIVPCEKPDQSGIEYIDIQTDITELKTKQEAAQRHNDFLEQCNVIAKLGAWEFSLDRRSLQVTRGICDIFDLPCDTLSTPELFFSFFIPEHRTQIETAFNDLIDASKGFDLILKITTQKGKIKWIRVIGLMRIKDGKPEVAYGVVKDISHYKAYEHLIERNEMRYAISQNMAKVGTWEHRFVDNHVYFSDAALSIFNFDMEKHIFDGTFESAVRQIHPEDREGEMEDYRAFLRGYKPYDREFRILTHENTIRWVRGVARIHYNEDNVAESAIGAVQDITESKLSAQRLQEAIQRANLANEAKSEFLANMSHEIRTPMNSILGFSELLSKKIENPQLRHYLDSINTSGRTLLALINDILDLSKIESGQLHMLYKPIKPVHTVREIIKVFSIQAAQKNVRLEFIADAIVENTEIEFDELRLRQILFNLIGNALKFTVKGTVTINCQFDGIGREQDYVSMRIAVADTGIGIPTEKLPHVFDAFVQVSESNTRLYGGTGLGLTICKRLTQLLEGTIDVTSELGQGSQFRVHFPKCKLVKSQMPQGRAEDGIHAYDSVDFGEKTILWIDPENRGSDLVYEYLADYGVNIVESPQFFETPQWSEKEASPALILVEVPFKTKDVVKEIIQPLRHAFPGKPIPIVLQTAAIRLLNFGSDDPLVDTLLKPFSQEQLVEVFKKQLTHTAQAETPSVAPVLIQGNRADHLWDTLDDTIKLQLLTFLREEERNRLFATCCKTRQLSKITAYADELATCAEKMQLPELENIATELKEHAENFNFEGFNRILKTIESWVQG